MVSWRICWLRRDRTRKGRKDVRKMRHQYLFIFNCLHKSENKIFDDLFCSVYFLFVAEQFPGFIKVGLKYKEISSTKIIPHS